MIKDINSGSIVRLTCIDEIGKAICNAFLWVPLNRYQGGCCTKEEEYTKILEDKYRMELVNWSVGLLKMNVLDLIILCTLQWAVDQLMSGRNRDSEVLDNTVREMWNCENIQTAFTNVC